MNGMLSVYMSAASGDFAPVFEDDRTDVELDERLSLCLLMRSCPQLARQCASKKLGRRESTHVVNIGNRAEKLRPSYSMRPTHAKPVGHLGPFEAIFLAPSGGDNAHFPDAPHAIVTP